MINSGIRASGRFLFFLFLTACFLTAFTESDDPRPVIYLIGDSTMSDKRVSAYPETGWGTPFVHYFTDQVRVENHARNGRSTRSFLEEGLWDPIESQLKEGDYVFIQFGHNDASKNRPQRYTTEEQYKSNLRRYVRETRKAGAHPILLTPIARRHFGSEGDLRDTHFSYSEQMRNLASEEDVPLIDMDTLSQRLINELGRDRSTFLYLHLEPGQNPNYPEGVEDNTHFNELGARRMAELVLQRIQELELGLAAQIVSK